MTSDFIDLGGTKSIRDLTWDADLPAGTHVEIRSQTGDTFVIERKYFRKNGVEVSEAQWTKLPNSQKLDVVEIQQRGTDWSGWSPIYTAPEAVFQSPSPRRYVQLQVRLGNDHPDIAPLLHSIALQFDAALISGGVTSRILPRRVAFDSLQIFTYVLRPVFRTGDQGFDRVRGDTLRVDLPQRVQRDSVEVMFQTRIHANATTFEAWVSIVGTDSRQGVRAEEQYAATVLVPSVASDGDLIRSVSVTPLVTPNGDGVNDAATIRFALAKVEATETEVSIHDLSGRRVRMVAADSEGYRWDGRDERGKLLPPGTYICRIVMAADVGEQTAQRIINLAY